MAFANGNVQNVFCTMPTATAAPPTTSKGSALCTLEFLPYCIILLRRSLAPGSMILTACALHSRLSAVPAMEKGQAFRDMSLNHCPFRFYGFCKRQRTERVLYHADCNRRPTHHLKGLCPLHSRIIISLLRRSAFERGFSPASLLFPALLFRSVSERRMDKADSDVPAPNLLACSVTG